MFRNKSTASAVLVACLAVAIGVATYWTSPRAEDFWWPDSASFALNGALVHDYLVSGFRMSPLTFANEWFRRFPAVTISLYPPIFPLVEAIAFLLFGVSHAVAQAVVAAFTALAAVGIYRTARTALDWPAAAATMLLFAAAPGVFQWSRQVMMEIPSLAFLLLASASLLRHQADGKSRDLWLSLLWTLAAIYTKQTAIFAVPAFAASLVLAHGWRAALRPPALTVAACGVVALLPLLGFTLMMAPQLLDIAFGKMSAAHLSSDILWPTRLEQTTSYILAMPEVIGWPLLLLSVLYALLVMVRGWQTPAERRLGILLAGWFLCGFAYLGLTGHFESRYAVILVVPFAIAPAQLGARLAGRAPHSYLPVCAAFLLFFITLATGHIDRIAGYDRVAAYILEHSAQDDVIWFQVYKTQNPSFSLRSRSAQPKVFVQRAEKLLVDYQIVREAGVQDLDWTSERLADLMTKLGVSMVVLEPDFWVDLPSMQRMQTLIRSNAFKRVATFQIAADNPAQRKLIEIYQRQHLP